MVDGSFGLERFLYALFNRARNFCVPRTDFYVRHCICKLLSLVGLKHQVRWIEDETQSNL